MKNLLKQIELRVPLTREEIKLVEEQFLTEELEANTKVLEAGNRERYMYFLSSGIMRGFRNIDGKLVVEHLIDEQNFFTSITVTVLCKRIILLLSAAHCFLSSNAT